MSELKGLDEALKMFKDMPLKMHAAIDRKAIRESVELVAEAARQNLTSQGAVDSGDLLRSIQPSRPRINSRKGNIVARVGSLWYGWLVERGFLHRGGKHIAARPWLVPALTENEDKVIEVISKTIKESVDAFSASGKRGLNQILRQK